MAFPVELFSTTAVRGGLAPDPATGAVLTPIYQSTTYHQQAVGVHKGFTYSRAANPTVSALEAALGALEDTPPAVCFATGMAAISTLVPGAAEVRRSRRGLRCGLWRHGAAVPAGALRTSASKPRSSTRRMPTAVAQAIRPNTRLVFIETPANPTLKLTDIAAIARCRPRRRREARG